VGKRQVAEQLQVEQEQQLPAVSAVVEQPQAGWLSRGWQATRRGVAAAGQQVSGTLSQLKRGVQKKVVSAQKTMIGGLEEVRSWSWTKTMAILAAIAVTFGIVITLYSNNGDLLNTISSSGVGAAMTSVGAVLP